MKKHYPSRERYNTCECGHTKLNHAIGMIRSGHCYDCACPHYKRDKDITPEIDLRDVHGRGAWSPDPRIMTETMKEEEPIKINGTTIYHRVIVSGSTDYQTYRADAIISGQVVISTKRNTGISIYDRVVTSDKESVY